MNPPRIRHDVPTVILCLVGLIVLGGAIHTAVPLHQEVTYTVENATTPEFSKTVTPDMENVAERHALGPERTYTFQNLSEESQQLFLRALEAPDNSVTIRTSEPPDLSAASEVRAQTLVTYQGEYYIVSGVKGASGWIRSLLFVGLGLFIGLPLLVTGISRLERPGSLILHVGIAFFLMTFLIFNTISFWERLVSLLTGMGVTWILLSIT